jgi:hypothetical protein
VLWCGVLPVATPADGDGASVAKARRKLAAAICKRLQALLECVRVLVGTIVAMPAVLDSQVCWQCVGILTLHAWAYQDH